MQIQIDSREKTRAITKIVTELNNQGIRHFSSKLFVGDYVALHNPLVLIDRKQNIGELAQNAGKGHDRFKRELLRLDGLGAKMYILVEQPLKSLEEVILWQSPHTQMTGERIYRILKAWERKHNIEYVFCKKNDTGKKIIELLRGNEDEHSRTCKGTC